MSEKAKDTKVEAEVQETSTPTPEVTTPEVKETPTPTVTPQVVIQLDEDVKKAIIAIAGTLGTISSLLGSQTPQTVILEKAEEAKQEWKFVTKTIKKKQSIWAVKGAVEFVISKDGSLCKDEAFLAEHGIVLPQELKEGN